MDISEIKIGMKVVVADPRLNCGGPEDHPFTHTNANAPFGKIGIIAVIQDPKEHPGKWVGLCLKEMHEGAHECDGLVPRKRGWWTRPEYLQTLEQYAAHRDSAKKWDAQKAAAKKVYESFLQEK